MTLYRDPKEKIKRLRRQHLYVNLIMTALMIVFLAVLFGIMHMACEEIKDEGLKNILHEVWEGK